MRSFEPGETWGWCFVDQMVFDPMPDGGVSARRSGGDDHARRTARHTAVRDAPRLRKRGAGGAAGRHPPAHRRVAGAGRRAAVVLHGGRRLARRAQDRARQRSADQRVPARRLFRRTAAAARRTRDRQRARARAFARRAARSGRFHGAVQRLQEVLGRADDHDDAALHAPAHARGGSAAGARHHRRPSLRHRVSSAARLSGAQPHPVPLARSDAAQPRRRGRAAAPRRSLSCRRCSPTADAW